MTKFKDISKLMFHGFQVYCNLTKSVLKSHLEVPISDIGMRCIAQNGEFKEFKDQYQNPGNFLRFPKVSVKFKVFSRIIQIDMKFKDFKDFFKDVATLFGMPSKVLVKFLIN